MRYYPNYFDDFFNDTKKQDTSTVLRTDIYEKDGYYQICMEVCGIQKENIQVWLVDQHLNNHKIGLDFIVENRQEQVPVALITADSDPELTQHLKELNIVLLKKPLKPASLRSWLSGLKISSSES